MLTLEILLQKRYHNLKLLGEGGFGKIYEVNDGNKLKVLKVLNLENSHSLEKKEKAIALFQREAEVLEKLNHLGIPKLAAEGYFTINDSENCPILHCLMMEKIPGVNLLNWLQQKEHKLITTEIAIDWLKQLVNILDYLHQNNYFHRDIKPQNIILKPDGQLVLVDFGAVRKISNTYLVKLPEERVTNLLSDGYTPWEQTNGKAIPQSDFFALGRTFVYVLTGIEPSKLNFDYENCHLIWRVQAPECSHQFADLIDDLTAFSPQVRPQHTREIFKRIEEIEQSRQTSSVVRKRKRIKREINPKKQIIFLRWRTQLVVLVLGVLGWKFLSPQVAQQLNKLAYDKYMAQEYSQAELYYRLAISFKSNYGIARYGLGAACEERKKFDCAYQEYRIASQNEDKRAASMAKNNLARLYILRDANYDEAVEIILAGLKQAEEVAVKSALHKNLGLAYLQKNQLVEAKTQLQKSINLDNRDDAYCVLSEVEEKMGDREGAIAARANCSSPI
ncbi:MAG: protein kinase [Oscillatoria sp. PMC 1051.18]|nr:protein kinase [Oscillatoria sp. PMC 1050.18]MEC5029260.1 protein kinase [Oscillatoria sp. PMC 1051.18]